MHAVELRMTLIIDGELADDVVLRTGDAPGRLWHEASVAMGQMHAIEAHRRGGDKGEGLARG